MTLPMGPNHRSSHDFVSDVVACCRRFRLLYAEDDCTRERLALVVESLLLGVRFARKLDAIADRRGVPICVVSDNGG
jgi:putative transposase